MIGTRPDCISREILEVISSYRKDNFELWIELGLQSVHDRSLEFLNRRHTFKQTENALNLIAEYCIPGCVNVILGIPGESWEEMMKTAEKITELPVAGVKIHHLHIIKDTPLAQIHQKEKFTLMTLKEYVSTVCDFIERLRPDILIHRLMGDRMEDSLVQPRWGLHKGTVLQAIEDEFSRRCTYQGFLYTEGETE
jgi:radical SAM protein (TIGR01212 family)